jgi:hypothetical protein
MIDDIDNQKQKSINSWNSTGYDTQKLMEGLQAIKKVSPEFNDLSLDVQQIMKESSNPAFLAVLIFKLTKEREETNLILKRLEEKFLAIQEILKASGTQQTDSSKKIDLTSAISILSEPDQHIMQLISEVPMVSAADVQNRLSYKNPNAASQRLNGLVKTGLLKRIRSGKKVFFAKN